MTLAEVLVAVGVLGVAMAAMAAASITALTSSRTAQDHVNAAQLINEVTEDLLRRPLAEIAPTSPSGVTAPAYGPVTRAGVAHTVAVEVRWVDHPCNGVGIAPPAGTPDSRTDFLRMHVTAAWTVKGTPRSLDTVMYRTPTVAEKRPAGSPSC